MTETALRLIITIFGSLGFWEFIKYLISTRKKKRSAEAEGILALLHNELYPAIEKVHFRGVVGYDELENIDHLYKPYIKLGGNGTLQRRYETIQSYERVHDDELEAYDKGLVRKDLVTK